MDDCSGQDPAYRPAKEKPRPGGASLLARTAMARLEWAIEYGELFGERRRRDFLPRKLAVLLAALAVAVVAPASASALTKDYSIISRDIMPSGEYGSVPTPALLSQEERQAVMYNALTPLFNHVTTADVFKDFKPEPVGA